MKLKDPPLVRRERPPLPCTNLLLKDLAQRTRTPLGLIVCDATGGFDGPGRTALFLIAQEALINVEGHACATSAVVTLTPGPGVIRMEIKNNGRWFSVKGSSPGGKKHSRPGLISMQEWAEVIGVHFFVESAPSGPATIRSEISAEARNLNTQL